MAAGTATSMAASVGGASRAQALASATHPRSPAAAVSGATPMAPRPAPGGGAHAAQSMALSPTRRRQDRRPSVTGDGGLG